MLKPLQSSRTGLALSMLNPDVAALQTETPRLEHNGLIMEPFPVRQRAVQFDLEFTLDEAEVGINGFLAYNVDLFFPETIRRMADHFQLLLEGLVTNPEQRVSDIPLLREVERRRIVHAWNDTQTGYPDDSCLHQLFERQARRTPDNVAVIYEDVQCTYEELDARADRLARHLRALGVGPDTAVGVCIDRSVELVIALLGILKAGGAYLPIDTDAPPARIAQMLSDSRAPVCLARSDQWALPADDRMMVIHMDQPAISAPDQEAEPVVGISPDNLVSIYYTSGSTGKPKGVASTHRGWVNRMAWMQQRYRLEAHETVLQKTTLTFDDAAVEFFWPLSVGARIAMLGPGLHRDPRAILNAAIRHEVAVLQFVPSMLVLFLESITPRHRAALGCLRHVISSGEALRPDLVRLFRERVGCALHNQWGPTEASIDATAHTCTIADGEATLVPIGRPIANTRVYILDERRRPVPVGVIGDLYVAGVGLARGYVGAVDRTAEAFVPNPFDPGTVMYRTGDRGYHLDDGSIIFLGRRDDQVKIRGQRVELAEIEYALAQHSAVQDCAVVALKQAEGYRLIAYIVPHPDLAEIKDLPMLMRPFLKEQLPDYMVPGWFVQLAELPRTTSGKIDRKRLPLPADERPALEQTYMPARTPIEAAVLAIWQRVLGLTKIGINDQFFELGGHSLDATRVISRIKQELQVEIPLRYFFEDPTIAALAAWIDQTPAGDGVPPNQAIARLPRQEAYELSHAQQRYWFQYQFDAANAYGTVLALDFDGPLDTAALVEALGGLVARHGILRTTYLEQDGVPRQVVHDTVPLAYQYHDLASLDSEPRSEVLIKAVVDEKLAPFSLTVGPLFRVRLYRMTADQHRLLLALHPVTFDGWSVTVLIDDLKALYSSYRNGGSEADLPAVVQYVDYAAWFNRRLEAGDLDPQKTYWLEQLSGLPAAPMLPGDFAVAPLRRPPLTHRFTEIDAALAARLHELSRTHGATLYMTLLAVLDMWLASVTGATDIVVGSALSGRTREELEGVFGVLWNPVALRVDLSGNPCYSQVLERARAAALGAYANQEYPFDLVVNNLRDRRGGAGDPYSVVLVVQNASEIAATFDGVEVRLSRSDFLLDGRDPVAEKMGDELREAYDLHIEIFDLGIGLRAVTRYNPMRFLPETIDSFLNQFVAILHRVVADPQVRLSQLESCASPDLDDLFEDAAGIA
jgi:amino acid adenylation domain-containing protein